VGDAVVQAAILYVEVFVALSHESVLHIAELVLDAFNDAFVEGSQCIETLVAVEYRETARTVPAPEKSQAPEDRATGQGNSREWTTSQTSPEK
jgi:hypothetical protein